jgi:hypothetical protein
MATYTYTFAAGEKKTVSAGRFLKIESSAEPVQVELLKYQACTIDKVTMQCGDSVMLDEGFGLAEITSTTAQTVTILLLPFALHQARSEFKPCKKAKLTQAVLAGNQIYSPEIDVGENFPFLFAVATIDNGAFINGTGNLLEIEQSDISGSYSGILTPDYTNADLQSNINSSTVGTSMSCAGIVTKRYVRARFTAGSMGQPAVNLAIVVSQ